VRPLRQLFARILYGGRSSLRSCEQACIDKWRDHLSMEAARILDRQLDRFNLIQHQAGDRLVVFYCITEPSSQAWPDESLFPLRSDEIRVARLKLMVTSRGASNKLSAEIVLHNGRLSSIEFNKPVPKGEFSILGIDILADPMAQMPATTAPSLTWIEPPEWVREWADRPSFLPMPPMLAPQRNLILKQIDAKLPSDYLEMLDKINGFRCDLFTVFGPQLVRKEMRSDGNYYVLAEIADGGNIAVAQGCKDGGLKLIERDGDEVNEQGASLASVLRKLEPKGIGC